jgi:hypothetical protein
VEQVDRNSWLAQVDSQITIYQFFNERSSDLNAGHCKRVALYDVDIRIGLMALRDNSYDFIYIFSLSKEKKKRHNIMIRSQ